MLFEESMVGLPSPLPGAVCHTKGKAVYSQCCHTATDVGTVFVCFSPYNLVSPRHKIGSLCESWNILSIFPFWKHVFTQMPCKDFFSVFIICLIFLLMGLLLLTLMTFRVVQVLCKHGRRWVSAWMRLQSLKTIANTEHVDSSWKHIWEKLAEKNHCC